MERQDLAEAPQKGTPNTGLGREIILPGKRNPVLHRRLKTLRDGIPTHTNGTTITRKIPHQGPH